MFPESQAGWRRLWSPGGGMAAGTLWLLLAVHLPGSSCPQPEPPPPAPSSSPPACPQACECSEAARTVKCVNGNLTAVPRGLPPYVRSLSLAGNRLELLPAGAFPPAAAALRELASLNLSGGGVRRVEPGAFAHLPALRRLDLSRNRLAQLGPAAFGASSPLSELDLSECLLNASLLSRLGAGLGNLTRLALAGNRLRELPEDALRELPALRHLDLSDNALAGLRAGLFRPLPLLQSLDLSRNPLRRLQLATLRDLQPQRLDLRLANDSWLCDCRLRELLAWLREENGSRALAGPEQLLCWEPESLRGRPLLDLPDSLLLCPDPDDLSGLQTSYVFLGIVLALIGVIFLLVLYLNRKGIKKWMHNIRDACRDHMEGYHYRYEITADPRLTHVSSNSEV